MKIAFICQAVDELDPVMAGTVSWLKTMAGKAQVESLFVIALRTGMYDLPENVEVYKVQGRGRIARLRSFYSGVLHALRRHVDCFFVYQSGPYPTLLLPIKLLTGKRIFQWRAHPHVGLLTRFNVRFCDNKVFTSTAKALPIDSPKVHIVGQGIDTCRFRNTLTCKDGHLVTVGRVSPIKRLDMMLRTVALLNKNYGGSFSLDIYGAAPDRDRGHLRSLEGLVAELEMSHFVSFKGAVAHAELPGILNRYRLFLNYADTALDRAVVEAMACGLPVVSTNSCFADILPADLRGELILPRDDIRAQGQRIDSILSLDENERVSLGERLRDIALRDHGIENLVDKILDEMADDSGSTTVR